MAKQQLFYQGPGTGEEECAVEDYDFDSAECDMDHLYAIHENGEWVASVCAVHKDAYKALKGIE